MSTPPRRRGPKPSLTREQVVDAALELIDDEGVGALNLRKLATRMGISAMTPYSYFADKDDLLSAAVDRGLEPLSATWDPQDDWEAHLRAFFTAMHRTLEAHPGLLELAMTTSGTADLDTNRQLLLRAMTDAGWDAAEAGDALRALTAYVLGYGALRRLRGQAPTTRHTGEPFAYGLETFLCALRQSLQS